MKKKALIAGCGGIVLAIIVAIIMITYVIPGSKYKKATELLNSGDYKGAVEAFTALDNYKDSAEQAKIAQQGADYQAATSLLESEDYTGAIEAFTALGDYKDSAELVKDAQEKLDYQIAQENLEKYNSATSMAQVGAYSDAYKVFESLGEYNDSPRKSEEMRTARYKDGKEMFNEGEYQKAYDIFTEVAGWTFHKEYAEIDELQPLYASAESLFYLDRFEEAKQAFTDLGDYADSTQWAQNCLDEPLYRNALELFNKGECEEAKATFDNLGSYKDSANYSSLCEKQQTYDTLKSQLDAIGNITPISDENKNKLREIFDGFVDLEEFSDSQEQANKIINIFFNNGDNDICDELYKKIQGEGWELYGKGDNSEIVILKKKDNVLEYDFWKSDINGKANMVGKYDAYNDIIRFSWKDDLLVVTTSSDDSDQANVGGVYYRTKTLSGKMLELETESDGTKSATSPNEYLSVEEELSQEKEYKDWISMYANEDINVRETPTMDNPDNIISSYDRGDEAVIIGETVNWYKIYKEHDPVSEADELVGYVRKVCISDSYEEAMTDKPQETAAPVATPETAAPAASSASGPSVTLNTDANIRSKANETASVVGVVTKGSTATQIGSSDGWVQIDYNGVQGYVKASLVG